MKLPILLLFIILLNIFINGSFGQSIICYHGESYDTLAANITTINCPSGKCLMFSSACSTYWATTCYNERKPMAIRTAFKHVKKYFNVSSMTTRLFSTCSLSACNYNNLSPFLKPIFKTPVSFDSLLWPSNLKKEPTRNTLQNGFELSYDLSASDKFQFIGQTFNNSRKVWIKYDFAGLNNTIVTYRFDLNLTQSFYVLKTFIKSPMKNAALQNTLISSTEKRALKFPTKPGEKLTFTLTKNYGGKYQDISINLSNISLPSDLQSLLLIQYGGNWIATSAKRIQGTYAISPTNGIIYPETVYELNPTFDIPKPSTFTCNFNSSIALNTTLKYYYIENKTSTYYTYMGTTITMRTSPSFNYFTTTTTPRPAQTYNYFTTTTTTTRSPISYSTTTITPMLGPYVIERTLEKNEIVEYEIRDSLCANSNLLKIQIENIQGTNANNKTTYLFNVWRRYNSTWMILDIAKKETEICGSSYALYFYTNAFLFKCNNTLIYDSSNTRVTNSGQYFSYNYNTFIKSNYVVEGIPQKLACNK